MTVDTNYWTRRSPFFDATLNAGCGGFGVANHMYQPHSYMDPLDEYRHLVEGVTLWDVATERQVEITGPDALPFMEMLTPRDVTACPVGRGRYIVVTSEDGGIINDPIMFRLAEDRFWLSTSDSDLLLWVKGLAVFAGMDVSISEPDVSPVQIQGPRSASVIERLFGADHCDMKFYEIRSMDLDDIPVKLSRTGWSGELGFEIFLCDSKYGEQLWQRILDAGQPDGLVVTGPSDIRRVEAGILGYGCDISIDVNPLEASLDWMLSPMKETDFIGKPALEKILRDGPNRRLVGIEMSGPPLPQGTFKKPWPVRSGGKLVGQATIVLYSPRLDKNIGYAMVETPYSEPGTELTVESPVGTRSAVTVKKPFISRSTA